MVDKLSRDMIGCMSACSVGPRFPPNHQTTAYAWAGRRRNITCRVLAEPDVLIEWLRGGHVVDTNETYRTFQTRGWRTSVGYLQVCGFTLLMATLEPQSNGPLYSTAVIGTLAVDGWAVTFGTARRGLGRLRPRPVPSSLYQM